MSNFYAFRENLPPGVTRKDIEGEPQDEEAKCSVEGCSNTCHPDQLDDWGRCRRCYKEDRTNENE